MFRILVLEVECGAHWFVAGKRDLALNQREHEVRSTQHMSPSLVGKLQGICVVMKIFLLI